MNVVYNFLTVLVMDVIQFTAMPNTVTLVHALSTLLHCDKPDFAHQCQVNRDVTVGMILEINRNLRLGGTRRPVKESSRCRKNRRLYTFPRMLL